MKLRDYQNDIIVNVYNAFKNGSRRTLVCLPTGAGKTACFAWMAKAARSKGRIVWFMVHRRELLEQTYKTFEKFGIDLDGIYITMIGGWKKLPKPDLIVIDEAHHSLAKTWQTMIDENSDAYVIGLTATPARLDGKPLGSIYDSLLIGPDTADLIQDGYLSPYRLIVSEVSKYGLGQVRKKAGDFDQREAEKILNQRAVYGDVIKVYQDFANGMQAIYFCTTLEHSKATAAAFLEAGILAAHFDGKTPKKQRDLLVQKFRNGEIRVLSNCELIGEGFDMPACDCVGMLRPTLSLSLYLQQAGRALRPRENKTAVIIDHVGNVDRHGTPSDHRDWSLDKKISTGRHKTPEGAYSVRQCATCFAVFPVTVNICPDCGTPYESTREEIENIRHIKMLEVEKEKEVKRKQNEWKRKAWAMTQAAIDEARSYADFCKIAKLRGYKKGWAYYQAKLRGFWVPY